MIWEKWRHNLEEKLEERPEDRMRRKKTNTRAGQRDEFPAT